MGMVRTPSGPTGLYSAGRSSHSMALSVGGELCDRRLSCLERKMVNSDEPPICAIRIFHWAKCLSIHVECLLLGVMFAAAVLREESSL
jgi:hypothetical protein